MRRCLRCFQPFLSEGDYCAECTECFMDLRAAVEHDDEPKVADLAMVSSWAAHGEPPEVGRRWEVR